MDLDENTIKRIENMNISAVSALVSRITKYISELSEPKIQEIMENIPKLASNLLKLGKIIPKDSFFGIIRHIVYQMQKEKGLRRAFFEKLTEELAVDDEILHFLEKREDS